MKAVLLTREYPPDVYGGAGVHVEYLAAELARLIDVEVRRFGPAEADPEGAPQPSGAGAGGVPVVRSFGPWGALAGDQPYLSALRAVSVDLRMAAGMADPAVVHSHTWYANLGGHLAKLLYGIPHVMTTHSLEPLRPWKAEQLGPGGYALSCFCERTAIEAADAVVAVSQEMRRDVLRTYPSVDPTRVEIVHNGIDPEQYRPDLGTDVLARHGVDPDRPSVVFVGRITRQKGLVHLLEAAADLAPAAQLVLCAGAPDTPDLAREIAGRVESLRRSRDGVIWIDRMLAKHEVIQILSHASAFCCPSIYEPMGIVNLEAMACAAPVVATATGGIPEVVEDGATGLLVPFEPGDPLTREPADPAAFAAGLAERLNALLADPDRAREMGRAGRRRAVERFSWRAVAERTVELYRRLLAS